MKLRFTIPLFAAMVLAAALWAPLKASAMASATPVAWAGKPVADVPGWPEGTIALVNDPLRTVGWNPWFSELSNEVNYYDFKIRDTDDINRLLQSLAAIKSTNLTLSLSPEKRAPLIAFTSDSPDRAVTAVRFAVGDQKQLDQWYAHLSEAEPGVRGFGQWRYKEAPITTPPTLMVFVGHEAVNLQQLKVPPPVKVIAQVARPEPGLETAVKAINEFVARRGEKSGKPASSGREGTAWVERCLQELEAIKPGMTRAEVDAKLKLDGGLQSASPVRYLHPDCDYFKVNVEFDFKRNSADQNRAVSAKDDKVIRVSKPYLERPFLD